jgi:hypothetical protein
MRVPAVSPPHPRIHRITVDERLDEDRVRLLITSLAPRPDSRRPYRDGERFQDHFDTWMPDEREVCISRSEFTCLRAELAISSTKITWKGMSEGCVYLAGEFSIGADSFIIARGQDQFEPIKDLEFVTAPDYELYMSVLVEHDARPFVANGSSVSRALDSSLAMAQAGGEP